MADWKEVRKEARSRDDRRQSSELHRNIRSRSSTPGSDSQLKHSAHMERERTEPSGSHLKRKRRRSSSSRSGSPSGDRKDKSRKSQPSVKSKKGKRDCNSSECTRHVTGATKSEHKHRKRKRKYSSPSSDSSSDSNSSDIYSSGSSIERRRKKKHMKREKHSHRLKKSARKKHKLKSKRKKRSKTDSGRVVSPAEAGIEGPHVLPAKPKQEELSTCAVQSVVPVSGKTTKMRGPMTKEEWEKQQSVVRRVYDPDTGRHRLVKGDGEIIEEIVSREQQKAINKQATLGDGLSFQAGLSKFL